MYSRIREYNIPCVLEVIMELLREKNVNQNCVVEMFKKLTPENQKIILETIARLKAEQ